MMNFDLTVQFVRDYEELRERMERQPGAVEAVPHRDLLDEIDRLRQQTSQLEARARAHEETARESDETARGLEESIRRLASSHEAESRKAQALLAAKERALEELRARCSALSKSLDDLKESQALDLGRGDETIRQPSGELAASPRELEGRMAGPAARRPDADAWQVARTRDADVKALRIQILAEFESRLERVIHLPLKLRLAAIVLDLLLLAIAVNLLVNSDPSRTEPANLPTFVVAVLAVFSLRTFLSPGRMLTGDLAQADRPRAQANRPGGLAVAVLLRDLALRADDHRRPLRRVGPADRRRAVEALAPGLRPRVVRATAPGDRARTLPAGGPAAPRGVAGDGDGLVGRTAALDPHLAAAPPEYALFPEHDDHRVDLWGRLPAVPMAPMGNR